MATNESIPINHPNNPIGTQIKPPMSVNDVHLMDDAVSSVIRVVYELKRKLSLCQQELAQERLVRKRLEQILFSKKSTNAKTCDLHARNNSTKIHKHNATQRHMNYQRFTRSTVRATVPSIPEVDTLDHRLGK